MKKMIVVAAVLMLAFGLSTMAVNVSIAAGPHDLTSAAGKTNASNTIANMSGGETCGFCHTPHNSTNLQYPLWNHTQSSQTFTPYTSPTGTLNATINFATYSGSLKCLGCHDGATSMASVITLGGQLFNGSNTLVTPTATTMIGPSALGTDLSNDHPVAFLYNAALATADGGLKDPTLPATISPAILVGGAVECGSCHTIHKPFADNGYLLRNTMAGSALCLNCHLK